MTDMYYASKQKELKKWGNNMCDDIREWEVNLLLNSLQSLVQSGRIQYSPTTTYSSDLINGQFYNFRDKDFPIDSFLMRGNILDVLKALPGEGFKFPLPSLLIVRPSQKVERWWRQVPQEYIFTDSKADEKCSYSLIAVLLKEAKRPFLRYLALPAARGAIFTLSDVDSNGLMCKNSSELVHEGLFGDGWTFKGQIGDQEVCLYPYMLALSIAPPAKKRMLPPKY